MGKIKELVMKMFYWIGYGIGKVLGLFIVGKKKKVSPAVIQCSKCGSNRIKVTSTIAQEDITESSGVAYTVYTYSVKCMDCSRCATFKEKWEIEPARDRIYLNVVDNVDEQYCPYCDSKDLVKAPDDVVVKIPDGFTLYVCGKCGLPVCVTCTDEKMEEILSEHDDKECDCCHNKEQDDDKPEE